MNAMSMQSFFLLILCISKVGLINIVNVVWLTTSCERCCKMVLLYYYFFIFFYYQLSLLLLFKIGSQKNLGLNNLL